MAERVVAEDRGDLLQPTGEGKGVRVERRRPAGADRRVVVDLLQQDVARRPDRQLEAAGLPGIALDRVAGVERPFRTAAGSAGVGCDATKSEAARSME